MDHYRDYQHAYYLKQVITELQNVAGRSFSGERGPKPWGSAATQLLVTEKSSVRPVALAAARNTSPR